MLLICPIAGVGKRLQPFTYSKPKAFLKVAGKRLIDHNLIKLKRAFPKGTNICFIVGYKKRQITEYLTQTYGDYFNIFFVKQSPLGYSGDVPYFSGLGDAILLAKSYVKNDDCFIVLSDRLPMEEYTNILLNYHKEDCDGIFNIKNVDNPQFYGVVLLDEEKKHITKIVEKPKEFISNYAVSGAYILGKSILPQIFDLLEEQSKIKLENGQEHQMAPVLQKLIENGARFKIYEAKGEILDFGRPEGLLEGHRHLLTEIKIQDPLYEDLHQSGNIVDSKIVPPVIIGENVKISNSVIGPNVSVGDDVVIDKCVIKESVIGDGASLKKIISSDSIIGDYTILEDLIKKCITIGDNSVITTSK